MEMKKMALFATLLIVAIISIGAVSATEVTSNNGTSNAQSNQIDVSNSDNNQVSTYGINDNSLNNVQTNDNGNQNELVNNDEIVDDSGITLDTTNKVCNITNSSDFTKLRNNFTAGILNNYTVNFASGNYSDFYLVLNTTNVTLNGNGATFIGDGTNAMLTISNSNGLIINGFNLIVNSNTKKAITGYNVNNCQILNNNITDGGDAINIFQYYTNLTIAGNYINNMSNHWGDAISLVNHNTTFDLSTWTPTVIENNTINNSVYGIFIGGNFIGDISGNNISNTTYGMQFQGKSATTNGNLSATVSNNILTNVVTGIEMDHPNVYYFNLTNTDITVSDSTNDYAINTNDTSFGNYTYIGVFNSNFTGFISITFYTYTVDNVNNTGFENYI